MYINKVFLYGNLTRQPELRVSPSGSKVCSFSIATNRRYKDQTGNWNEASEYHSLVAFGRSAELIAQYLTTGSSAFIEGRLQTRSWEGPDGKKNFRTEVVVEQVQFGPRRTGEGQQGGGYRKDAGSAQNDSGQPMAHEELDTIEYPTEDINPDDIPF
ncbi:MAG: single-stranded DNA-binding protein [Candidatus Yonathbacteria bacterium]|nr:single-stranded DNA-binding protein [Candidatus Yonathbacteria bacterium]NTW48084.1 single-stranded DNA-binding protein [Candidatus Yonathbacteria bacterium]